MKHEKETPAERRAHIAQMKHALSECLSSRQRTWLREAIAIASRNGRP